MSRISEIQIIPVRPKEGLVAFANLIYDDCLFLGCIAIYTRIDGGYRLVYPKKGASYAYNPIRGPIAMEIADGVIAKYEEIMNKSEG